MKAHAGEHVVFVQIPGDPPPATALVRMVRSTQQVQPTILPAAATQCPVQQTTCPALATACVAGVETICPAQPVVTQCPRSPTACPSRCP